MTMVIPEGPPDNGRAARRFKRSRQAPPSLTPGTAARGQRRGNGNHIATPLQHRSSSEQSGQSGNRFARRKGGCIPAHIPCEQTANNAPRLSPLRHFRALA
jgi:hypothetical protein